MPQAGDPTLDQLRVLAAIADEGSFSAAARRLRRSQSVISYTIANLEAQLGVALFDRSGRAPILTEAGRALMADARRIGGAVDDLRARAGALRQGTEAELGLAVDVMFPIACLVDVLRRFAAAFPTVTLRLRIEALGGVLQMVLSGDCVLGVSGGPAPLPDAVRARFVGALQLVPVAAPSHPLAALKQIGVEALREHTQLVLSDASRVSQGRDQGVISLHTWRLGDMGARHALLRAGLGWCYMPDHLVAEDIAAGRLRRLCIGQAPGVEYQLSLLHRADTIVGPAACWLADAVVQANIGGGVPASPVLPTPV